MPRKPPRPTVLTPRRCRQLGYWDIEQIKNHLGVHVETAKRYCRDGTILAFKDISGRWWADPDDLG